MERAKGCLVDKHDLVGIWVLMEPGETANKDESNRQQAGEKGEGS